MRRMGIGEGNWSNVLAMLCHSLRCSTLPSNQISNSKYATDEPWQEKGYWEGDKDCGSRKRWRVDDEVEEVGAL